MRILVTGATGAIGKEIASALAREGHNIVLACRDTSKAIALADMLRQRHGSDISVVELDLSDSISVREAAQAIAKDGIDALVNNAGVMNKSFRQDADGHENTLNVNYYNTRLLTELLIPHMPKGAHIVFTTSATRRWFPFQKISGEIHENNFSRMKAYALSKKLITAYAACLAEKLESRGIYVNCTDPGVVDTPMLRMGKWFDSLTDIFFRPFCLSPEKGARGALNALDSDISGLIFKSPSGIAEITCGKELYDFISSTI